MNDAPVARSRLLTPPGSAAIAVARVEGPGADRVLDRVVRPPQPTSPHAGSSLRTPIGRELPSSGRLRYARFVTDGEVIDDVVLSRVETGGLPAFDICMHGGIRIVERVLETLERLGAPLTCDEKGASGPIWPVRNRIEREAVDALVAAATERCVRFLATQYRSLAHHLTHIATLCETDAPEAASALTTMLERYQQTRILLAGATVTIVGPPNTGKSTLFNRLVGRPTSIIAQRAGTTRDWVEAAIDLQGIPVTLVDTAGRHGTDEDLECAAIRAGLDRARRSHVDLFVLDGSLPLTTSVRRVIGEYSPHCRYLTVANKVDVGRAWHETDVPRTGDGPLNTPRWVSARTGIGIDDLEAAIVRALGLDGCSDARPALFTDRQVRVAANSLAALRAGLRATIKQADIGSAAKILKNELIDPSFGDAGRLRPIIKKQG